MMMMMMRLINMELVMHTQIHNWSNKWPVSHFLRTRYKYRLSTWERGPGILAAGTSAYNRCRPRFLMDPWIHPAEAAAAAAAAGAAGAAAAASASASAACVYYVVIGGHLVASSRPRISTL